MLVNLSVAQCITFQYSRKLPGICAESPYLELQYGWKVEHGYSSGQGVLWNKSPDSSQGHSLLGKTTEKQKKQKCSLKQQNKKGYTQKTYSIFLQNHFLATCIQYTL